METMTPPAPPLEPPRATSKPRVAMIVGAVVALLVVGGLGFFVGRASADEEVRPQPELTPSCEEALDAAAHAFDTFDRVIGPPDDDSDLGQFGRLIESIDSYMSDPYDNGQGVEANATVVAESLGEISGSEDDFVDAAERCLSPDTTGRSD